MATQTPDMSNLSPCDRRALASLRAFVASIGGTETDVTVIDRRADGRHRNGIEVSISFDLETPFAGIVALSLCWRRNRNAETCGWFGFDPLADVEENNATARLLTSAAGKPWTDALAVL